MSREIIKLFDREFVVSAEKENGLIMESIFADWATTAEKEYKRLFNEKIHNIDDIIKKGPEIIEKIFYEYAKKIVERIVSNDVYGISENDIVNAFFDKSEAQKAYFLIEDKYESVLGSEDAKNAYRRARRQNRGRWVGGGFGIGGAIKGAATAGAMNMTSGAVHGMVNLAGSAISSIGTAINKSSIFNEEKSQQTIAKGIWFDIYHVRFMYARIMEENTNFRYKFITSKEVRLAETLFKNVNNFVTNLEKQKEILFEILQTDGTNSKYYLYGLKKFPQESRNILKIAELHCVDMTKYTEQILQDILKTHSIATEESALKTQEILKNIMKELGVTSSETMQKVNEAIKNFDILARTYKNVLYDTREECKKAIEDDKIIMKTIMFKFGSSLSRENLIELLEQIKRFDTFDSIKKEYKEKINKRILEGEENELKEICKELQNSDEKACYKIMENVLDSKAREELKDKYMQIIDKRIEDLQINELKGICKDLQNSDEKTCHKIIERVLDSKTRKDLQDKYIQIINKRIEDLRIIEEKNVFNDILSNVDFFDEKAISDSIATINERGKSEIKNEYINVLNSIKSSDLKKAIKYSKYKKSKVKYVIHIFLIVQILLSALIGSIDSLVFYGCIYLFVLIYNSRRKKLYNLYTIKGTVINKIFK